jgi:hypothetical protein
MIEDRWRRQRSPVASRTPRRRSRRPPRSGCDRADGWKSNSPEATTCTVTARTPSILPACTPGSAAGLDSLELEGHGRGKRPVSFPHDGASHDGPPPRGPAPRDARPRRRRRVRPGGPLRPPRVHGLRLRTSRARFSPAARESLRGVGVRGFPARVGSPCGMVESGPAFGFRRRVFPARLRAEAPGPRLAPTSPSLSGARPKSLRASARGRAQRAGGGGSTRLSRVEEGDRVPL